MTPPHPPVPYAPGPPPPPPPPPAANAAPAVGPTPAGENTGAGEAPQGLAWAAGVTIGLSVAGSVLGLVRDQTIAHLFGAGAESDAFLVAWTVPEVAATLLIEDAMALLMVPAFSAALARGGAVRGLVRGTLPRLLALLGVLTATLVAGAPYVVRLLAPGLADTTEAVACTRLTAVSVLTFGLAGYLSAALRAHRRFVPPAAIYVAYNVGIIATLLALHGRYGVTAAAAGVAVGGALMVAVQLPAALAELRHGAATAVGTPDAARPPGLAAGATEPAPRLAKLGKGTPPPITAAGAPSAEPGPALAELPKGAPPHGIPPATAAPTAAPTTSTTSRPTAPGLALLAPVVLFTLSRQAQVLVERYFAAPLPAGAISHLNYAQKVAQLPMALSLMICTVTFPVVSRALAEGDREKARRRVERDLTLACVVVLLGTAYVIACAPQLTEVLFQRGEFTAGDTAATAAVMRVYALGLLGQSLVGALVRPYFSAARPTWYPAAAMAVGLLVTGVADGVAVGPWGVYGIAAGNAAGITVTAGLLLRGLGAHSIAVRVRSIAPGLAKTALAAGAAAGAGWLLTTRVPDALGAAAACGLLVPTVFTATAVALRVPELPTTLATATRRAPR